MQGENQFLSSVISEGPRSILFSPPYWTEKRELLIWLRFNVLFVPEQNTWGTLAKASKGLDSKGSDSSRTAAGEVSLVSPNPVVKELTWDMVPYKHMHVSHQVEPFTGSPPMGSLSKQLLLWGTREHPLGKIVNRKNALSSMPWASLQTSGWEVNILSVQPLVLVQLSQTRTL